MRFVCSLENTTLSLGVFSNDQLLFRAHMATDRNKTADEYQVLLSNLLALNGVTPAEISDAIVASVVRPLNDVVSQAICQLIQVRPLFVGPGVKTGLDIKTDIPSQVGADIVANAVGALGQHAGPLVFIDFGTATTVTAINEKGELCGVLICPGVRISLDALSAQTTDLPGLSLEAPRRLFGRNTIDAMLSGVIYGHASMVEGLLDRIADTWNNKELTVMVTGRHAEKIMPHLRTKKAVHHDPDLTFKGLRRIFQLNDRRKASKPGSDPSL